MSTSREELMLALNACNFRELVELFNFAAMKFRDEEILSYGERRVYSTPVIVLASYAVGEPVECRIVALPSESNEGYISNEISQSGRCERCRCESAGFSKEARCAVCGATVDMT